MKFYLRFLFPIIAFFALGLLLVSFVPSTTPFVLFLLLIFVLWYTAIVVRDFERQRVQVENRALVDREQAKLSRRESELSLRSMIDTLPVGICIISKKGIVRYVNQPFNRASQVELKEGNTYHEMQQVSPLYEPIYRSIMFDKSLQSIHAIENATYQLNSYLVQDQSEVSGFIIVVTNITDVKLAEQRQRDFLADITHELKTPLSAIMGAAQLILRDRAIMTSDELNEFMDIVHRESLRMNNLVSELVDLTRIGANLVKMNFLSIPLHPLVEEVHTLIEPSLHDKQIEFHNDVPTHLKCYIDHDRFKQVLINLLTNAVRYTSVGSITVKAYEDVHETVIDIVDTGIGIAKEDQPRIFQRFFRVDKARSRDQGGTGIGLAVTKAIVEAHQGSIHVVSELNNGSTFSIRIPQSLQ